MSYVRRAKRTKLYSGRCLIKNYHHQTYITLSAVDVEKHFSTVERFFVCTDNDRDGMIALEPTETKRGASSLALSNRVAVPRYILREVMVNDGLYDIRQTPDGKYWEINLNTPIQSKDATP